MKTLIALLMSSSIALLNVNVMNILPSLTLLVIMGISILLDFITGVVKAVISKEARTSKGYRKTVVKFIQYGGGVTVGLCLKFYAMQNSSSLVDAIKYINWFNDGLILFIIFIELTSIMENLYAVDKTTPFARYFVKPVLSLMIFELKNNPVIKAADQIAPNDQVEK